MRRNLHSNSMDIRSGLLREIDAMGTLFSLVLGLLMLCQGTLRWSSLFDMNIGLNLLAVQAAMIPSFSGKISTIIKQYGIGS